MRSDEEILFFLLLGVAMVLMLINIAVMLYFAYFKVNDLSGGLSRSPFFLLRKSFMGRDPFSRMVMILGVALVFTFPSRHLKNGELDADDYARFPSTLKSLIKNTYLSGLIIGMALFAIAGFGKWMGWVE